MGEAPRMRGASLTLDEAVCGVLEAERLVSLLPPHLVVILWLLVHGWTYREMADAHGVSHGQVYLWVKQLRRTVGERKGVRCG